MWFQLGHKVHDNIHLLIYFTTHRRMDLLNKCWQNNLLLMKCPVTFYSPSRLRKEPEEKGKDTQTGCWGRWIQGSQMSEGWQQKVKVGTCKKYMHIKLIWLNKWNDFKGHKHRNTVGHLQCLWNPENSLSGKQNLHLCFKDTKHMLQNRPLKLECSTCLYTWTAQFPELWHRPCL